MKKTLLISLLLIIFANVNYAQIGGKNAFKFLTIPSSARATMVGGTYNSVFDNDVSLASKNPATLNPSMSKLMSVNYINYYSDINYGNFNYVHDFKPATFQFGATYLNYGDLPKYDVYGKQIGLMTTNQVALNVGAGKSYHDKYKFGANAKVIVSQFSEYTSVGMAFDLAAIWTDTAHLLNVSLNVTNLGFQLKTYRKDNQEFLPLDVQLSISKRLKHMPFRFILTAHHLYTWDIRYDNPNNQAQSTNSLGGEVKKVDPAVKVLDNIAKHLIFGGELYLGKIITVGIGYNHLRRSELAIPNVTGLSGFSFGFGVKINRFTLQYGFAKYALPQSVNHLTLNINLGKRIKIKRRKKPSKAID